MARANVARRQGDEFQARLFWLRAASLLDPRTPVIRVGFESGPKSFDDILIEYDPKAAPTDHEGKPLLRRHIQCKWHTTAGAFGYEDLPDPAFVNAERFSFLQKAHLAQQRYAADGLGCRFELVTNWRIKHDDPLMRLVRKQSGALDRARLFDGTTDASAMGKVRKRWREHLGIDHAGLDLVVRTLAIEEMSESLDGLRDRLDERFAAVGMRRIPAGESAFLYDDLAAKLLAQGRIEFDRDGFRAMAEREGLMDMAAQPDDTLTIGVRSFIHPIDSLEDRCPLTLNLVPHFDGRYVRNEADWRDRIFPELRAFLLDAARSSDRLRLILDAHTSLAFAAGTVLNVKAGKRIELEQRTGGRRYWSPDDQLADSGWPQFEFQQEVIDAGSPDLALAVGLTHDVSDGVRRHVGAGKGIGQIVHCRPQGGPSQFSVRCGRHAWMLAEAASQYVRRLREGGAGTGRLHIFIAAPNGFTFFLGQHQQAIGPVAVYEWDFDGQRGGGYSLGLSLGG